MPKKSKADSITIFRDKCKRHNLSMTPQRMVIYKELTDSKNHPCAEEIYEKVRGVFPDISLDTVYRTLSTFSEIGVIDIVEGYGEARRYDPDIGPHHHFRCRQCNNIVDFNNESYDNLRIPKEFRKNFKVTNLRVVLEGTCDKCAKRQ